MDLDRNDNPEGTGKYALLKLRDLARYRSPEPFGGHLPVALSEALTVLESHGLIDYGNSTSSEFFVIRLKDKYARGALHAYAAAAFIDDPQWGDSVAQMAERSGRCHYNCQRPT